MKLVSNKAQCKLCGDTLESKYCGDFRECKCGEIWINGGIDRPKHFYRNNENIINLNVYKEVK
jgi:tRNA(Ile2) C34 agmatinyltransferase TiaS